MGTKASTATDLLSLGAQSKLVALFNAEQNSNNEFQVVSRYSRSKYAPPSTPLDYKGTATNLSAYYGLSFEHVGGSTVQATLENNQQLRLAEFRETLFESIVSEFSKNSNSTERDQVIALALWGLRGSYDGKKLYAVDPKDQGDGHLERIFFILGNFSEIPVKLNERKPDDPRDDQLRVDTKWLNSCILGGLSTLNLYKAQILRAANSR